jgi:hypothetical protein
MMAAQQVAIKCPECDEDLTVDVTVEAGEVTATGEMPITLTPNLAYAILHMFCHEVTT